MYKYKSDAAKKRAKVEEIPTFMVYNEQIILHSSVIFSPFCFFVQLMIISKPKPGTLFSLGLFIAISLSVASYTAIHMWQADHIAWHQYALVILLYPIGLGLAIKVIWGYKLIYIGKDRIDIRFPTRFKTTGFRLRDIHYWKETEIKTATGTYKEVTINFQKDKHLTLSHQEHTNYPKVVRYLKKKCSQKLKN